MNLYDLVRFLADCPTFTEIRKTYKASEDQMYKKSLFAHFKIPLIEMRL
jgi:hypothetical protein